MKRLLVLVISTLMLAVSVLMPAAVLAQNAKDSLCQGVGVVSGAGCAEPAGGTSLDATVKAAVNIISVVVGVVAVIMIMIGGFKYITSAGESSKISSAKDTILYAVIGLVVAMMAQVLVRFVIARSTGG